MADRHLPSEIKPFRTVFLGIVIFRAVDRLTLLPFAWLLATTINVACFIPKAIDLLVWTSIAILLIGALRAGCRYAEHHLASICSDKLRMGLRRRLADRLSDLPKNLGSGEAATIYTDAVDAVEPYFTEYLPAAWLSYFLPVIFIACVWPFDWISGFILLATAPVIPLFMYLIGSKTAEMTRARWQTLGMLGAYFLDVIRGVGTLKVFGRSRLESHRVAERSELFRTRTMAVLRVAFLSAFSLETLATLSVALVAVSLGVRLYYGKIDFQIAMFILIAAPGCFAPLRELGAAFHAGMDARGAATKIFQPLDEETIANNAGTLPPPRCLDIALERVSYQYPGTTQPALISIDANIPSGSRVAIIGSSGAGKSTLIKLLMGFMAPDRGAIRVDGVDLREIDLADWRRLVSWVAQEPLIINGSIHDNIALAAPKSHGEQIEAAARAAGLDTLINSLPMGLDTPVGDAGCRLSGGELRRLAIARACLRDSPIWILDEPSSNLDPIMERDTLDRLRKLTAGKTVITISHRSVAASQADLTIHLEKGRRIDKNFTFQNFSSMTGKVE